MAAQGLNSRAKRLPTSIIIARFAHAITLTYVQIVKLVPIATGIYRQLGVRLTSLGTETVYHLAPLMVKRFP